MSSACVSVEDAITTARIASSPSAASTERTSARYLEASSTAASRSTSTTYLSLARERLGQVATFRVDALEGEALRRIEPVIIGFLERALDWEIVGVVLVRRITGRVAAGRDDLHHQQMIRWLRLRKNVTDETLI